MEIEEARKLLEAAEVFYCTISECEECKDCDTDEEKQRHLHTLNLNDAFYWACADCEKVSDEELPEVARLFKAYGMCGIYYWVFKKRGWNKVEFVDINRFVEFVRHEEEIIEKEPDWDKRGYLKVAYSIGEVNGKV